MPKSVDPTSEGSGANHMYPVQTSTEEPPYKNSHLHNRHRYPGPALVEADQKVAEVDESDTRETPKGTHIHKPVSDDINSSQGGRGEHEKKDIP